MNQHEYYIKKCLDLAYQGAGFVAPNPLVGAVVLDKQGNVVGEGYHQHYGQGHAEVYALDQAGEKAQDGTLYVNLEPCSHFGKTPPCVDKVIAAGAQTVVIAMMDPNPKVAGAGIQKLKEAGIEVIVGVLQEQTERLNEKFIKYITQKHPFVMTKIACTLDGKIATASGSARWITSEASREIVHQFRKEYTAILTTSQTVCDDNPHLTCRLAGGRNPIRLVLDRTLRTNPEESFIYHPDAPTFIFTQVKQENCHGWPSHCTVISLEHALDQDEFLTEVLQTLPSYNIDSVMIEAGAKLNGSFLRLGLADKVELFMAPKIIGDPSAPSFIEGFKTQDITKALALHLHQVRQIGSDAWMTFYP